jgi:phenylacetate-coenzyme A ligase PaaK-like adenylate-forming protein
MPAGDRERAILERLRVVCRYAYNKSSFYRRCWDDAGFHPDQLRSLEDFEDRVPVITRSQLEESQASSPPFGDYLCISKNAVFHMHQTSGTTGTPIAFAIERNDWLAIANAHARVMWAIGTRPGDTICIAADFGHYMGSWGVLAGAERLGAKAFPFRDGGPGTTVRCVDWLHAMKPAGLYCTASYALHLAQIANDEGIDPREFGLKHMFFTREPGASTPSIRTHIVELFGAKIFDLGSTAEMSPWMHIACSAETEGMLCWQDIVYTEVCNPNSMRRVPYGRRGTLVYTHLERTSQPMIRFVPGDLALWLNDPNPCGRTYPRLPTGAFGRIEDMFSIRGEDVYPSEIDAVLNQTPGYGGEHQIIVTREVAMNELLLRVEADEQVVLLGAIEPFRAAVMMRMQTLLGLPSRVEIVAKGSLPHPSLYACRVIKDRELTEETKAQLYSGTKA